jgi:hypothetical protein
MPLETCLAFNKLWNNKFYYKAAFCWLFLLIHTTIHISEDIKHYGVMYVLVCGLWRVVSVWLLSDGSSLLDRAQSSVLIAERYNISLLEYCAASNSSLTFRDNQSSPFFKGQSVQAWPLWMGLIGCPETVFILNLRTAAFKAYCAIWIRRSSFRH